MLIDVNNSGFIDKADLVKATGGYIPESFFTNAIKLMDTNKDGKISFEEYKIVRGLASSLKEARSTTGPRLFVLKANHLSL